MQLFPKLSDLNHTLETFTCIYWLYGELYLCTKCPMLVGMKNIQQEHQFISVIYTFHILLGIFNCLLLKQRHLFFTKLEIININSKITFKHENIRYLTKPYLEDGQRVILFLFKSQKNSSLPIFFPYIHMAPNKSCLPVFRLIFTVK